MRNSAIEYQKDLMKYNDDYQERLYRFKDGAIYSSECTKAFRADLQEVRHGHISLEDMALDWVLPVVIIKYFIKYGV